MTGRPARGHGRAGRHPFAEPSRGGAGRSGREGARARCTLAAGRAHRRQRDRPHDLGRSQRLVLAGHLDTVPANDNARARIDGDVLWGLGSSDMKGGLAVMLDLAATVPEPSSRRDLVLLRPRGGGPRRERPAPALERASRPPPGDAAILGEPTDALVEAGCQGTMRVRSPSWVCGPTRPGRSPGATPSTGWRLIAVGGWGGPDGRAGRLHLCRAAPSRAVEGGVAANVVPDRSISP